MLAEQASDAATSRLGHQLDRSPGSITGGGLRKDLILFVALAALAYSVCLSVVVAYEDFWRLVGNSGDNRGYIGIAQGIREWNPQAIGRVKLFWGTGYGILLVHSVTPAGYAASLVLLSAFSSLLAVTLAYRLYGRSVAACFVFISAPMIQRTLMGGSEPLFVALLLAAFVATRSESLEWGVFLASLATTVKPIGVFAVAPILLTTIRRKSWTSLGLCVSLAVGVGVIYATPLFLLTGSLFGNFSGYSEDWYHRLPVGIPFHALLMAALHTREPFSNTAKIASWLALVVFIVAYYGLGKGRLRASFSRHPEETMAFALIVLFQISYNSTWAWAEFPRFIAPAVPFLLAQVGLERIRTGWFLISAPLFGLLGASEIVGFQRLLQSFRSWVLS